jgi:hypothetical protein
MLVIQAVPVISLADRAHGHAPVAFAFPPAAFSTGLARIRGSAIRLWRFSHF